MIACIATETSVHPLGVHGARRHNMAAGSTTRASFKRHKQPLDMYNTPYNRSVYAICVRIHVVRVRFAFYVVILSITAMYRQLLMSSITATSLMSSIAATLLMSPTATTLLTSSIAARVFSNAMQRRDV